MGTPLKFSNKFIHSNTYAYAVSEWGERHRVKDRGRERISFWLTLLPIIVHYLKSVIIHIYIHICKHTRTWNSHITTSEKPPIDLILISFLLAKYTKTRLWRSREELQNILYFGSNGNTLWICNLLQDARYTRGSLEIIFEVLKINLHITAVRYVLTWIFEW